MARAPASRRNRRIFVAVGIALAFLLVGLALGGVFSGGGNKRANKTLTRQTARTTTQSPTPALLLPAATVKFGDRGNAVKELQRALRSLGYTVGTIDGVFGASTQSALIAFQTAHHLTPDGVLGPATRAALLMRVSQTAGNATCLGRETFDLAGYPVPSSGALKPTADAASRSLVFRCSAVPGRNARAGSQWLLK